MRDADENGFQDSRVLSAASIINHSAFSDESGAQLGDVLRARNYFAQFAFSMAFTFLEIPQHPPASGINDAGEWYYKARRRTRGGGRKKLSHYEDIDQSSESLIKIASRELCSALD